MLTPYANPAIINHTSLKVLYILAKYIINIVEEADLLLVCPPFLLFLVAVISANNDGHLAFTA